MYVAPMVIDFKNYFNRDFPYGADIENNVLDTDITKAFGLTELAINPVLWGSQNAYTTGYLFLAAHFLVLNIRASTQGLNGQYNWAQNSKAVSGVAEAFTIPDRIANNPDFMQYTKTNYGAQYLNLLWPKLSGVMFTVCGRTLP